MENKYGMIKTEKREMLPAINLLRVPHKKEDLTVALFGPDIYKNNIEKMSRNYFHSKELPKIFFKPATTSKSISTVAYDFEKSKKEIFDPRWLQAGYIVRTQDGVFVNTNETNESTLKSILDKCEKVNGIYLGENDFGFAPYESFKTGVQDCDTFCEGGLARVLEHTKEKVAENLRTIASPKFYKKGVNVWGFGKVNKPMSKVVSLGSGGFVIGRLVVDGDYWDGIDNGYAFGVCAPAKSE